MYLTFDFPRDNTPTEKLEKLIKRINTFLSKRVSIPSDYPYFRVTLVPPNSSVPLLAIAESSLAKFQHSTNYLLFFQFFDKNVEEIGNQRLVIDLGSDPKFADKYRNDITLLSCLSSFPLSSVNFHLASDSISILVDFSDANDANIANIIVYVVLGKEIPHRYCKPSWFDDGNN